MLLSEEQTNEITQMAELFFNLDEIAANIEVDPDEFRTLILIRSGPAYDAYMKGWLRGEIPLRKAIAQAAANGSNPAQQMLLNMKATAEIGKL
jgi:CO/xanthine dehydrogenase Mo-binding subunit